MKFSGGKKIKGGVEMCGTQPDLARAIMDLRVEEARRVADGTQPALATGKRLVRRAVFLLDQARTWLVSLGEQLAHSIRTQPST